MQKNYPKLKLLFCLVFWEPKNLAVAIFNEEGNYSSPLNVTCNDIDFSCPLIEAIRSDAVTPVSTFQSVSISANL